MNKNLSIKIFRIMHFGDSLKSKGKQQKNKTKQHILV